MLTHLSAGALLVFIALCLLVPIISALLTHTPSWATGVLTLLQATIIGIVAEWYAAGDAFDWKSAIEKALLAVAFALGARKVVTEGKVENEAHAKGPRPSPVRPRA
jgi:hypothetical protein